MRVAFELFKCSGDNRPYFDDILLGHVGKSLSIVGQRKLGCVSTRGICGKSRVSALLKVPLSDTPVNAARKDRFCIEELYIGHPIAMTTKHTHLFTIRHGIEADIAVITREREQMIVGRERQRRRIRHRIWQERRYSRS